MTGYLESLAGGMLIGLAVSGLLLINGRIAGVSGIVGRLAGGLQVSTNAAFVAGLMSGPPLYRLVVGQWPAITLTTPWPLIVLAGLLVGFGTRMAGGCTSGHGVAGLARLSPRSAVAVLTFLTAGVITVTALKAFGP